MCGLGFWKGGLGPERGVPDRAGNECGDRSREPPHVRVLRLPLVDEQTADVTPEGRLLCGQKGQKHNLGLVLLLKGKVVPKSYGVAWRSARA